MDNVLTRYRNFSTINTQNKDCSISLPSFLNMVVCFKKTEWKNQNIQLDLHITSPEVNQYVVATPSNLFSMFSNLLNNSVDASLPNSVTTITLNTDSVRQIVSISDNGSGMSKDEITLAQSGISSKHNGPGLGLKAAHEYMQQINGELIMKSQPAQGTTITLIFPTIS